MKFDINSLSTTKKRIKPWGEEIIYTNENQKYTFKQIKINDGCRLSLQSHTEKTETFVLIEGEADLVIGNNIDNLETFHMEIKKGYSIPIGLIHRMIGIKNAVILESSTPETGITIRYQDDYQRPDETESMRRAE
ncbi:MAG: cupin [Candidatus Shapirobacteria bacterium]|jgi:mannose-6-phosphate isomerase-like protein (cupin superfamily)